MGALETFLGTANGGVATGAASGLLNFGLGQIGAAIQHKRNKQLMDKAQQQELEQMEKSQEYNLANMEVQNQYQIDAENRANAWNSAEAQVNRAREAGVSPLAALGSGGAGGTMSVSSAPSSSTPQGSGSSPSTGSAPSATFNLAQAMQAGAQIGLMAAEKSKSEAETKESEASARNLSAQAEAQEQLNKFYQENKEDIDNGRLSESKQKTFDFLVNRVKWTNANGDVSMDSAAGRNLDADTEEKLASAGKHWSEKEYLDHTRDWAVKEKQALARFYNSYAFEKESLTPERVKEIVANTHLLVDEGSLKKQEWWFKEETNKLDKEAKEMSNEFQRWYNNEVMNHRDPRSNLEKTLAIADAAQKWLDMFLDYKAQKEGLSSQKKQNLQNVAIKLLPMLMKVLKI